MIYDHKTEKPRIGIGGCFWQRCEIFLTNFPQENIKKILSPLMFNVCSASDISVLFYVFIYKHFFSLSSFCCSPTACRNSAKCSKTQMASGRFARFLTAVEFLRTPKQENSPENPWKNKNVNKGCVAIGKRVWECFSGPLRWFYNELIWLRQAFGNCQFVFVKTLKHNI